MINPIEAARAALSLKQNVEGLKLASDIKPQISKKHGLSWKYPLYIVGAIGGVVAAVVGGIFLNYPLVATGIYLVFSNIMAARDVRINAANANLKDLVGYMAKDINAFHGQLVEENKANKNLKTANDALDKNVKDYVKIVDEGVEKLEKQKEETQKISAKLSAVPESLERVSAPIKAAVDALTKDKGDLQENVDAIKEAEKAIEEHIERLSSLANSEDQEEAKFAQKLGTLTSLAGQLFGFTKEMKKQTQDMNATLENEKQIKELLREELKTLRQVQKTIEEDDQKLDSSAKIAKKSLEEMHALMAELKRMETASSDSKATGKKHHHHHHDTDQSKPKNSGIAPEDKKEKKGKKDTADSKIDVHSSSTAPAVNQEGSIQITLKKDVKFDLSEHVA